MKCCSSRAGSWWTFKAVLVEQRDSTQKSGEKSLTQMLVIWKSLKKSFEHSWKKLYRILFLDKFWKKLEKASKWKKLQKGFWKMLSKRKKLWDAFWSKKSCNKSFLKFLTEKAFRSSCQNFILRKKALKMCFFQIVSLTKAWLTLPKSH